jgi:hypothetical protein
MNADAPLFLADYNSDVIALLVLATQMLTTTQPLAGGGSITITSSGKPTQNAREWSCAEPKLESTSQYVTASESGGTFNDPEGKSSGSASWSGLKRTFYEGEKVTVTLKVSNMIASFRADSCANGESSFSRGVRHPWDPDRSSLTFEFVFQPVAGRNRVAINIETTPGVAGRFSSGRAQVSWVLTPGKAVTPPSNAVLTVADAQVVSAAHLMHGSLVDEISDIAPFIKEASAPVGIAADGASLLVLRAESTKADNATFTIGGAGGALYPLAGTVPMKSVGVKSLNVATRESGGKHYAIALYRPPSYFGSGPTSKPLDFKVKFAGGAEASLALKLVPPPIVLVHGTYDNPRFCYQEHSDEDDTSVNMAPMLQSMGYDVTCVDWEETNGNKDPSEFQHNRETVYKNPGGIKEALEAVRRKGIVVSQADVICHSQGGAIARTYARGFPFSVSMPPTHPHYTDPTKCRSGDVPCWFHRPENCFLGDIHRLITISTTHRGSHVLNVFKVLDTYPDKGASQTLQRALVDIFLIGIDKTVSGITTGGVKNQIPDSLELQLIGPTPVPSHAIACVASDDDMRNQRPDSIMEAIKQSELGMGNYWNKFYKVWLGTTNEARDYLFVQLCKLAGENGMPDPDGALAKYRELVSKVSMNEDHKNVRMDALIYHMRKIVFQGQENDCTVGILSSFGGLSEPYRTRVPEVLHGWAPRYRSIQLRVLRLITGDGSDFDQDGFPGYSGIKSKGSTFTTVIPPNDMGPPILDSAIPLNPNFKPYLKVGGGVGKTEEPAVGLIGGVDFSPGRLAQPDSWKDSSGFGGTAKFENGRLELASPNEPEAEANTFLKSPLRGDFDLVIDYRLDAWKSIGDGQVQWDVMLSPSPRTVGEDYILLGRRTTEEGDMIAVAPWNGLPGQEVKAATTGSGKLRISRKGAMWRVSQWDGKAWQEVLSFESAENPNVYLGFGLSIGGGGENAKVSVQIGTPGN